MKNPLLIKGLEVQLRLPGDERSHPATIMDVHDGHGLLRVPDDLAEVELEDDLELRFGHAKLYWRVFVRPIAHFGVWWFLEQPEPDRCKPMTRRRYVRIRQEVRLLALPESAQPGQPFAPIPIELVDFSVGGARVRTHSRIDTPRVKLVVNLPDLDVKPVSARVVREELLEGGSYAYGLDFDHVDPAFEEAIAAFVARKIQYHLRRGDDITT